MKKLLLFLMLIPSLVSAQTPSERMVRWNVSDYLFFTIQNVIYDNGADESVTASTVTASNANLSVTTSGYRTSGWPTGQAPDYNKYVQFSVAPVDGKDLVPKMFRFQQAGGCDKLQVRYSTSPAFTNGGTLLLQSDNADNIEDQYINVSFPAGVVIPSGQTLYIRIYGYDNNGGNWYIRHNGWFSNSRPEFYGVAINSITANPDAATTLMGQAVNINVTGNDLTPGTTITSVSIVSGPSQGTVVVQQNNTITYTPGLLTLGNITFQYKITAANGATATATVTVTVSPLINPVAANDSVTLLKNTTAGINVLANDTPGSGIISIVSIAGAPLHGSVVINSNTVYYTPDLDYTGTDLFTYTITDIFNNSSTATVNLIVNEPVLPGPGTNAGVYCGSSTTWNGTQWSNGLPSASKDVIFAGNFTQSGGTINACSIFVTGTAQVVFTGNSNAVVTHNVNVAETASLTFESSSNLVQTENTPNVGVVTVKRKGSKLKRLDYTFWSSPVTSNQTLLEFSPATLPDRFYAYNTIEMEYISLPSATTTFTPAKGYLIRMPNSITVPQAEAYATGNYRFSYEGVFTGVPNNGAIEIPLEHYQGINSYNLVGNPYPSPISATAFIMANINNIEGTIWLWRKTNNPNATSYCTLTTLGFIANNALGGGGTGGNDGNDLVADPFSISLGGVLNTGQGFIVKAKNNTNLVFTNSMRRSVNFANFFRNADDEQNQPEEEALIASRIWLNVNKTDNEGIFAQTLVGYTPMATLEYDNGIDGHFMAGGSLNLYSVINSGNLCIQGRPDFTVDDAVQLGFKAQAAGDYTFSIDHVDGLFEGDQQIYIKDNLTGVIHNIKDSNYTFTTEAGTFDERFEVVYSPDALSVNPVTAFDNEEVIAYSNSGKVGIKSTYPIMDIVIYDISGKQLYNETGIDKENYLTPSVNIKGQAVIIKLRLRNGNHYTRKLLIP